MRALGAFQSPSLRGSGRFATAAAVAATLYAGFNPLHCGAVVASRRGGAIRLHFSPFQSPSLRGSGRFEKLKKDLESAVEFQSPSLRGSGRFAEARARAAERRAVSIPFIAGQWSLPRRKAGAGKEDHMFQSPSLRGSGRFK